MIPALTRQTANIKVLVTDLIMVGGLDPDRITESQVEDLVTHFVPDLNPVMKAEPPLRQLVAHQRARARKRRPPRRFGIVELDPLVVADDDIVEDMEEETRHLMRRGASGRVCNYLCWTSTP